MTSWTAGYVADIDYTHGYYTELNPHRIKLAFLNAGYAFPEVGAACELGFGQGMSANLHAAASTTSWYGNDFNPAQAAFAQELAAASGASANLSDEAFADFCSRPDLPDFDFIGLHGIWSWISDTNRSTIVDFVRRKLKVGGVLYISYNTLPGWGPFAPMRHLLTQHAETMGAKGSGVVRRIDDALAFADQFISTSPLYARVNSTVESRLSTIKTQNRNYLAHEYFNADWHPMYFADMAKWLAPAKLTFACSTHLLDHIDAINLTETQQKFLNGIADLQLRQTARDFVVNQQFRKDYWVKGVRSLPPLEQAEGLRSLRVLLTTPQADVPMKVTGAVGEGNLSESVYGPLLGSLNDYKIRSIGQVELLLKDKGISFPQLIQAIVLLNGTGHIQLAQDEAVIQKARKTTDKVNAHIEIKSRGAATLAFLASPVTGGGVAVERMHQLFLLARSHGNKTTPANWAAYAWSVLISQGQRVQLADRRLETAEENIEELTRQAVIFAESQLPILKALHIA
jgi:SAM-dependent methyltransferase